MDMFTAVECMRLEEAGYTKREMSFSRLPLWTSPGGEELTHEAAVKRLNAAGNSPSVAQDGRGRDGSGQMTS